MALDAHTHLRHTPAEDDADGLDAGEGEAYTSAEGRECMIFSGKTPICVSTLMFPNISNLAKQLPIQTIRIQQKVIHADKPDKEAPQLPGQLGSLYGSDIQVYRVVPEVIHSGEGGEKEYRYSFAS